MSAKERQVYRTCHLCRRTYNVSSIDPGGDVYICPTCESRARRFLSGGGKEKTGVNENDR